MGQSPLGFFAQQFSGAFGGTRVGVQKDTWQSLRHGKFYSAAYGTPANGSVAALAGALFRGSNQTAASLSAALATTYTGLCLNNPAASTVNLVVRRASVFFNASASAAFIGLISGWSAAGIVTHTTSLNADIVSAYVGGAASGGSIVAPAPQANLDAACTLVGTPIWDRWIGADAATTVNGAIDKDLEDDIIIPPGGYIAIGSSAAEGSTPCVASFMWEEVAP